MTMTILDETNLLYLWYRYNDDVFDRIWQSANWPNVSIAQSNSEIASDKDVFSIPSSVMKAAIMPENVDQPIQLIMNKDRENTEYFAFLQVTEFSMLQPGEVREYIITINGVSFYGPYKPMYLEAETIYSTKPIITGSFVNVTIERTNRSTLPPLLSVVEFALKGSHNCQQMKQMVISSPSIFSFRD